MPPNPTPASAPRVATDQPSARNVFDRQPLLIPPRSDARADRWYRRRAVVICLALLAVGTAAAAIRFGAGLRESFTGVLDH